jgi:hypothetical protein
MIMGERHLKKFRIYISMSIAAAILVALGILGVGENRKGIMLGTVTDALSDDPVYKARISVGGRSTIRYKDKKFRITNLEPGTYTLNVSAPDYESVTREVTVERGGNRVDIVMRGTEISGLDHIIVFSESVKGQGIKLEIRFVNREGKGIDHFPRLPLAMGAKLYEQYGTKGNPYRGRLIYSGPVELFWDRESYLGKNKGILPKEKLGLDSKIDGRYGILDVVLRTTQGDFENTVSNVLLEW